MSVSRAKHPSKSLNDSRLKALTTEGALSTIYTTLLVLVNTAMKWVNITLKYMIDWTESFGVKPSTASEIADATDEKDIVASEPAVSPYKKVEESRRRDRPLGSRNKHQQEKVRLSNESYRQIHERIVIMRKK